ncbi:ScyD/ScyE family protein [Streptomyces sp. NPDC051211]|uniref:ScyD/ScyE family protein n=1 Tax=Streptomyces sp. NPDC051211 TaxID=3154643 RepID=UPI00344F7E6C
MSTSARPWRTALLSAATAVATAALAAPLLAVPAQAQARTQSTATLEVLASGLNNVRDVTALWDGRILVAEAGQGNPDCATAETWCVGKTGSVYQVNGSRKGRVLTGLPSIGQGSAATGGAQHVNGPSSVAPDPWGGYLVLTGQGGDSNSRAALGPEASKIGTLFRTRDGKVLADLTDHETRLNPDGLEVHSNAWDFVRTEDGYLITDAGANTLLRADCTKGTTTAFTFPKNDTATGAAEAVPTGIVRNNSTGTVYVADMSGTRPGAARIWKIEPGGKPEILVTGLSNLVDIALDKNNNLYALSFTDGFQAGPPLPGRLSKIDLATKAVTEIPTGGQLQGPTGLDIGPQGQIYVSHKSAGANGELVRVRP